jgi:hypothetical protein
MRQRLAFWIILAYLWVMMILLGAIVMETFMVYPNVFHDPPRSLELGLQFMSVRAPSDFFPPLGFLSWVTGGVSLSSVKHRARAWTVPSSTKGNDNRSVEMTVVVLLYRTNLSYSVKTHPWCIRI